MSHSYRWAFVFSGCLLSCLLVSIVSVALRDTDQKSSESYSLISDNTPELVHRQREWRLAQYIPPGKWEKILGWAPPDSIIRLAILPREITNPKAVIGNICLDGKFFQRFEFGGKFDWFDYQIPIPSHLSGEVTIQFESAQGFRLAWCDIVSSSCAENKPNFLIILIDTLRQDHLGCYGYTRPTSLNLDAFSLDAIKLTHLVPQSSWTRPSVASLLTSCYPSVHGAIDRNTPMRKNLPSLEETFRKAGYQTHAIMTNPSCLPYWEMGCDFNRLVDLVEQHASEQDDALAIDEAIHTLNLVKGTPWLLYLHLMGPHSPYTPHEPFTSAFDSKSTDPLQQLIDKYDAEIAYTDAQIGRLLNTLRENGEYESTCILVLSDHGEQFYEHGKWGHGLTLFEEELRVPCLIKLPDNQQAGTQIHNLVQMIDIAPTLCDIASITPDPHFQGKSFYNLLQGESEPPRLAFASLALESRSAFMARNLTVKFLHDRVQGQQSWFDLQNDPGELQPLTSGPPESDILEKFATQIAATGTEGLNILITGGEKRLTQIEGVIRSTKLSFEGMPFESKMIKIACKPNELSFSVEPNGELYSLVGLEEWYKEGEQANVLLNFPIQTGNSLSVEILVDGQPVPKLVIPSGYQTNHTENLLMLEEIIGTPFSFDAAVLPKTLAAYIWYVPPQEALNDQKIDERIEKALTSLGYLN